MRPATWANESATGRSAPVPLLLTAAAPAVRACRGLLQLCCGRWFGLMRTLLFSRSTWRLRNLVPTAQAPVPGPGVSQALNREAIQQVRRRPLSCKKGDATACKEQASRVRQQVARVWFAYLCTPNSAPAPSAQLLPDKAS